MTIDAVPFLAVARGCLSAWPAVKTWVKSIE